MYESKCLSCALFWKTQKDKNKRCYLGGSDGGMIDFCTGYVKSNDSKKNITKKHTALLQIRLNKTDD